MIACMGMSVAACSGVKEIEDKEFKDAVKEVNEGYECGICLEKYNDLREGDIFEVYEIQEYRED